VAAASINNTDRISSSYFTHIYSAIQNECIYIGLDHVLVVRLEGTAGLHTQSR
jgi:hypothetical protein